MTNIAMELHDSTITAISEKDGTATIQFSPAYIHKSEQRPGVDSGTGWIQDACLKITEASIQGSLFVLPSVVWDGEFLIDSLKQDNIIPLPLSIMQSVILHIELCNGEQITIRGSGAKLELIGECKYIEDFVP
jgi:hypothetical protein